MNVADQLDDIKEENESPENRVSSQETFKAENQIPQGNN